MIKTRLIGQVPSSKKYIALTVLAQWIRLCANIVMMFIFSHILELILGGATMTVSVLLPYIIGISAVMQCAMSAECAAQRHLFWRRLR